MTAADIFFGIVLGIEAVILLVFFVEACKNLRL